MAPLLFVHLFLTVAAVVIGKTARDALLLAEFTPVQLAALDAATLLSVLAVLSVQLRTSRRLSMPRILVLGPVCFACGDLALAFACARGPGLSVALAVYVWLGVQASFSTAHAALLVNHVSFGSGRGAAMAGAGAVLGWISGGVAAQVTASAAGATSLVLVVGLLTLMLPVLIAAAARKADLLRVTAPAAGHDEPLRQAPSRIWQSPYLRLAAGITLCSAAASSIATFQFRSAAVHSLSQTDELAVFLGSFQVYAGIAALAVQLVSMPLLRRLGRGVDLMLAPGAMALASIGVFVSGTLVSAVVLRGSEQVFRYSLDRSARERLYARVPRGELFDGRTFIETALWRLGDVAGTLIALAAVLLVHMPFTWLSVPVMLLALTGVGLAFGSRRVPLAA